ncbi:hypothetical protein LCGC14_1049830 [marine sediment metagenome]|uniref:Uncharacterized protein n=1 Tax=marine sediment metagenome TaxID=412755 RepID=A0A0F9MTN2_9ZZZZ
MLVVLGMCVVRLIGVGEVGCVCWEGVGVGNGPRDHERIFDLETHRGPISRKFFTIK